MDQYWGWILSILGLIGFYLTGKKIWWGWWVNVGAQTVWYAYAIVTQQWGFLVMTTMYTIIFTKNAVEWTKDHKDPLRNFDFNEYAIALGDSYNDEMDNAVLYGEGKPIEPYSFTLDEWTLRALGDEDALQKHVDSERVLWMERENITDLSQVLAYIEPSFSAPGAIKITFRVKGGNYEQA